MKIVAISDLHGMLDFTTPACDVLCICGDIVPLNIQSYTKETFKWLETEFLPWCNQQPCETILLVGGNHDLRMCSHEDKVHALFNETKVHYLLDESYEYIDTETGNVVKFYGTPWCHIFGNWAFMISDDEINKKLRNMPDDVDVLLTHDAPYGVSDVCFQKVWWNKHEHIGCKPMRDAIIEHKPKYCLHGHLHSTNHACEMLGDTQVYNVSLLDETYTRVYEPFELTI